MEVFFDPNYFNYLRLNTLIFIHFTVSLTRRNFSNPILFDGMLVFFSTYNMFKEQAVSQMNCEPTVHVSPMASMSTLVDSLIDGTHKVKTFNVFLPDD